MSNKLEAAVRDPSVRDAKRAGVKHKRMHFGHGAANSWPDDLFLFADGHHWWVEFKKPDGEATPKQDHEHKEIRAYGGDVSVVDTRLMFGILLAVRVECHGSLSASQLATLLA